MGKGKKSNLIIKTWERCKSIGRGRNNGGGAALYKSKSWPSIDVSLEAEEKRHTRKSRVAPEGCFTVYVGPQKQVRHQDRVREPPALQDPARRSRVRIRVQQRRTPCPPLRR
ncbi:hypothetical protein F3Y22_tig00110156pilonHSYRG00535 [Hibiscus syriacus]|uniref:Uncharacterized protein n=1 Tax=Hibiscus syriacus TaxID=106335 RepID=A0A6A3BIV0_HIBSY|nr:hypothetical protein F3Y22_tig00110156pilonHSYRG00535 [Hibiscus syriacus]